MAESHPAEVLRVIGLDPLPTAAAVPALPPTKFAVDELGVHLDAAGQSFDETKNAGAVRFTRGAVGQVSHAGGVYRPPPR